MRLAKTPTEIVLGEVIRQTEGDIAMVECFADNSSCRILSACRLKGILGEALSAMFLVLDDYTLADLLERPEDHVKAISWRELSSQAQMAD